MVDNKFYNKKKRGENLNLAKCLNRALFIYTFFIVVLFCIIIYYIYISVYLGSTPPNIFY